MRSKGSSPGRVVANALEPDELPKLKASSSQGARPGAGETEKVVRVAMVQAAQRVFVSHAVCDADIAAAFVEEVLRSGLEIPERQIFRSSKRSTGVPTGNDWSRWIRNELETCAVFIALGTDGFHASPFCHLELGSAWLSGSPPIVLNHASTRGVVGFLQTSDLGSESALNEVADTIRQRLGHDGPSTQTWETSRNRFIAELKRLDADRSVLEAEYNLLLRVEESSVPILYELFHDRTATWWHPWKSDHRRAGQWRQEGGTLILSFSDREAVIPGHTANPSVGYETVDGAVCAFRIARIDNSDSPLGNGSVLWKVFEGGHRALSITIGEGEPLESELFWRTRQDQHGWTVRLKESGSELKVTVKSNATYKISAKRIGSMGLWMGREDSDAHPSVNALLFRVRSGPLL